MTLLIPDYIRNSGILSKQPVNYEWLDDDVYEHTAKEVPRLKKRIQGISLRGIVALAAACTEWVAWRLEPYADDKTLFSFIEAIWAGIIDWNYINPEKMPARWFKRVNWMGPVQGPLGEAFNILEESVRAAMGIFATAHTAVYASNLVEHIIDNKTPFRQWRNTTIETLIRIEPFNKEDPVGQAVPREFLNPDLNSTSKDRLVFLSNFLKGIKYDDNQFLRSPSDMRDAGFQGTPYAPLTD